MEKIPDVAWESPTPGAELTDLTPAFQGGLLEMITDARDRRRIAFRIHAPGLHALAALGKDVRFLVVLDGVRSTRAMDWAESDAPRAPKDPEERRAWIAARHERGRMQSREWRSVADGGVEMNIVNCMTLSGPSGVAFRIDGMVKTIWREIVVTGASLFHARSDRHPFDQDALIRLGEAYRAMLPDPG